MKKKTIIILNIVCPIIIGTLIYYLISPDVIFIEKIDAIFAKKIHLPVFSEDNVIIPVIRNYLPDMLWGYAFIFALFLIIGNNTVSFQKICFIAFSFSAAMETLQLTPVVKGTFDPLDIGVEFLSEAIAVFIIKYLLNTREEIKNEKEN